MHSKAIGNEAERRACAYLEAQGLSLVIRNYHCRFGEIDLIMRDKAYLVFVEVRTRLSNAFGGALASVTKAKQKKLLQTAQHFQSVKNIHGLHPLRFDVVILEGRLRQIEWIKNAFGLDY